MLSYYNIIYCRKMWQTKKYALMYVFHIYFLLLKTTISNLCKCHPLFRIFYSTFIPFYMHLSIQYFPFILQVRTTHRWCVDSTKRSLIFFVKILKWSLFPDLFVKDIKIIMRNINLKHEVKKLSMIM